eukprot:3686186-Amphidinium_carterae.1
MSDCIEGKDIQGDSMHSKTSNIAKVGVEHGVDGLQAKTASSHNLKTSLKNHCVELVGKAAELDGLHAKTSRGELICYSYNMLPMRVKSMMHTTTTQ